MSIDYKNEWIDYQTSISKLIIKHDELPEEYWLIGGLDISFHKFIKDKACGYITIYDLKNKKIVYEDHELIELTIPYESGFLGFREIPVYKKLLDRLKNDNPNLYPHIIMIDGFGILHPRGVGSASQLGYELNIPTIGIGKTLLCLDGLNEKNVKSKFKFECKKQGDYILLQGISGIEYGAALYSSKKEIKSINDVCNPIYITIGHKISLITAIKIVLECSNFRIPEPIRNSDIKSKLYF
ncbi:endonuclease V [Cotonvirus japonicus]|uniref:Endonuclease V n=1 Tax=Cotonvirus japonicus TaxID=2811091 RepID=A0ABM7NU19_9VIRU|nr:endonuclease V [Cotonvirus japonicus]BCS83561.1 endonuclease V [Cotonvirus japonicus]